MLDIAAICLVVTAVLAYLNHRFVKLPTAIGVMAIALAISLGMLGLDALGMAHGLREHAESFLRAINDGVGVVIFALLLGVLASGTTPSFQLVGSMLLREARGGRRHRLRACIGVCDVRPASQHRPVPGRGAPHAGSGGGGYALASRLHVSGPLAMVVCGLIIGNGGRALAMSDRTRQYVDMFWELTDEILNAVLFVLMGLEVLVIAFTLPILAAGALAIAVTLGARWVTVGLPVRMAGGRFKLPRGSDRVLVWGGLRGGISVALALSLPAGPQRELILALTYCVVVFSILVQGLTIGRVVKAAVGSGQA